MSLNDLPKVLIRYIGRYLEDDFLSYARFSIINKKFQSILPHIATIFNIFLYVFPHRRNYNWRELKDPNLLSLAYIYNKNLSLEIIKFLFEMKSNLNCVNKYGKTPVLYEFEKDNVSMEKIAFLIENKSLLNHKNSNGNTVLHISCRNDKIPLQTIIYLVENKSDINSTDFMNNTPLHVLVKNDEISYEKIKFLIETKTYLNITDKEYCTPLVTSIKKQIPIEIIQLLVENCDLNSNDPKKNILAPIFVACKSESLNFEIIRILVENKCDLKLKDVNGDTPLHLVCENENVSLEIIQFLIENKSDMNKKNSFGETPIKLALNNELLVQNIIEKYGKNLSLDKIFENKNKCLVL